jgi:hypothetical protein
MKRTFTWLLLPIVLAPASTFARPSTDGQAPAIERLDLIRTRLIDSVAADPRSATVDRREASKIAQYWPNWGNFWRNW